ncbi:unnamed protein product [Symbiodinium natans]|uniref:Uncharacterized protein n=1 Tax=Symbiodinium natans TaxID=878477 RepID=A0A812UYR3_9DINO|nr:unnamed protein product [Symbiodinium natans]
MPQHGKTKNPNKLDDSDVFLSRASMNRFPDHAANTLFFTATSFDFDSRAAAPEEGKGPNFMRLHEIGRRDCEIVKYPEIPNLTRKSQTYSISFGPKQSTDWEVNKFVMAQRKATTNSGPKPAPDYGMRSTYQDLSAPRSKSDLERSRPAALEGVPLEKAREPSLVLRSLSQETHGGDHSGFQASGEKFLPIHYLDIDGKTRPDFWYSSYGNEFVNPSAKPHKDSVKWRKRHGHKLVKGFLKDLGAQMRETRSTGDIHHRPVPVGLVGTDKETMRRLATQPL